MTDYYKTTKECLTKAQEKAIRYDKLKEQIRKEIKRHRILEQVKEKEDFRLAHNMMADYLEELLEQEAIEWKK